eukprot:7077809-Prymnesium_polylepis.1
MATAGRGRSRLVGESFHVDVLPSRIEGAIAFLVVRGDPGGATQQPRRRRRAAGKASTGCRRKHEHASA